MKPEDFLTRKRVELVYGTSGSGKTSWALAIAEAIWKTYGLRTRWYLGDGGRETIDASGMIEDGIVEVLDYINYPHPFETSMRMVQGWWPRDGAKNAPLVAPGPDLGARYGMFVFEGLTVMSGYMMGDIKGGLRQRNAAGDKIKEAGAMFKDGDMDFATNSAANYGTVQEHIITRIEESRGLPGWVQWTAHQTLAEEKKKLGPRDGNGPTISAGIEYGPAIVGQALTPTIGAAFGNTVHLHPAKKTVTKLGPDKKPIPDPITKMSVQEVEISYRAYTRRHLDPHMKSAGTTYFANARMPPAFADMMPEFFDPPDPLAFYRVLAEGKARAREARAAGAQSAPGTPLAVR